MGAVTPCRVAIVDDHVLVRQSMAHALIDAPELDVDVVLLTGSLAKVLSAQPAPELVLLDLDLGDTQAQPTDVRLLMERGCKVLVVSALGSPDTVTAMVAAGVAGFVSKREDTSALIEAVSAVIAGGTWTTPELAGILANDTRANRPRLSPQEQRVLVLYTSGLKLDAVAHQLGIKPGTAREYLERIRMKYHDVGRSAPSKTALYQEAVRDGIVPPPR